MEIPGLLERYGMRFDRNTVLPVQTRFMFEQVIEPITAHYHKESILAHPETGYAPNWLIFFTAG